MHRQRTIGQKLFGCFSGILLVVAALSYAGISAIATLDQKMEHVVSVSSRKVELVGEMNTAESDMYAAQRGVVLYASVKHLDKAEENRAKFQELGATIRKTLDEIHPLLEGPQARKYHDDLSSVLTTWQNEFPGLAKLALEGKIAESLSLANERVLPLHAKFGALAAEFTDLLREQMKTDAQNSKQQAATSTTIAWVLIFIGVAVGGAGLWVVRGVNKRLRQIATELGEGAEQVASASGQVSSASQSLAQGASEQAASLEETSASTEEITSMTKKNAENSGTAADVMGQVDRKVTDANRTLGEMVVSMHEINASSDKIARIIKVIDEIAFQTNILALNAAVEAARAGEAGMGFAVVADEVRNLAQRCAQAAKDTAALIEESISKSKEGRTRLEQVTAAIGGITDSALKVKTLVDEVNLGSQEQARGIEQISKAISQMEQVTQKTAANAEESASASEEMSSQAQVLQSLVDQLQGMVGGGNESGGRGTAGHPAVQPSRSSQSQRTTPGTTMPLASLGRAVGFKQPRTVSKPHAEPVVAGRDAFPLDEDFKEF